MEKTVNETGRTANFSAETVPCVRCGKRLDNIDPAGNQPNGGTEFVTHGHYGSAVSDFMDGTGLAVNVCDPCLREAMAAGSVLKIEPAEYQPRPKPRYSVWVS